VDRVVSTTRTRPGRHGPDVLVKGADWALDAIVGREEVEAAEGACASSSCGRSTTSLVSHIRHRERPQPSRTTPGAAASWVGAVAAHPQIAEARRILATDGLVPIHGLAGPARLLVPLLVSGPPLLVVVGTERLVERVTEDLRTLAQETGAAGAVLALPAPGPAPFRGPPRHPEARRRRARPCTRPCAGV
jgi:hypothetical protein